MATSTSSPLPLRPAGTARRRATTGALLTGLLLVPTSWASAAGGPGASYTEQDPPTSIGAGVTFTAATDSRAVEFSVLSGTAAESLQLATAATADVTAGAVSVVGSGVWRGDGTTALRIGTVDAVSDGKDGRPLRVSFATAGTVPNGGFESGTSDWTVLNGRVDLGVTEIAGFVSQDTTTYPAGAGDDDAGAPWETYAVTTGQPSEGAAAVLLSSTLNTSWPFGVVHGPAIYSAPFDMTAGDLLQFDWRADWSQDAHHVLGYLLDTSDGTQVELLDSVGTDSSPTPWATAGGVAPRDGEYRFVFVAGSYDLTGGQAAGSVLLVDDVRLSRPLADDSVVQGVARLLQYSSTSDAPPPAVQVAVDVVGPATTVRAATVDVAVAAVDDAPTVSGPGAVRLTNSAGAQTFAPVVGALSVSDADGDAMTFTLTGSRVAQVAVGGVSYTHALVSDLGTLRIDAATGRFRFEPDPAAVDAVVRTASRSFPVQVTAGALTTPTTIDVTVDIAQSAPGTPTGLTSTPLLGATSVSWVEPSWLGGGTVDYGVELSVDGGATWTVATTVATTSTTLPGLAAGQDVLVRVRAVNAFGSSSAAQVAASAIPAPGVVHIDSITAANRSVTVAYTLPVTGPSPVTAVQHSVDGGTTWVTTAPVGSVAVGGLTNGEARTLLLRAVNAAGEGPATSATVTALLAPVLVPGVGGSSVLPHVAPGQAVVRDDGGSAPATVSTPGGLWTVFGGRVGMSIATTVGDGAPSSATGPDGFLDLQVGGSMAVFGTGFMPGSRVDLWIFSTPHLLGEAVVGADGTFSARFTLPAGVVAGDHTVQLNGTAPDGSLRSLMAGVVVQSVGSSRLPATGSDVTGLLALSAGLLVAGAGALAVRRRGGARG
ncbi:LPXTG cell wall anchor domain-containing protein [Cellulomonas sp. P22]|uniref:LPXTG cell wall anchor domain-containing protein n=1 Tax=Cellulomonas sp. P22 TaxID=3373189 RepID=UPI003795FE5C